MSVRHLDRLLRPRSVALIGASARPGAVGHVVLANMRAAGFAGPIYPVNPRHGDIDGLTAFPTVAALPAAPDLAVIATPPDTVPDLIASLGKRGTPAAVVITAGFGEGGTAQGQTRREAMLAAAKPTLMRILGPNCFGLIAPHARLNASFARGLPPAGGIGFVTQSGAMMAAVMDWAAPRGIGFSVAVSLGDMADVDFGDLLDWLCLDPATSAILLYVEAVTHPRKFMSAARAAARVKPVIVIKSGRYTASAKAAASHTGALAGSDAVYDAAFARAGLLRVRTMQQVFDTVALLAIAPRLRGDRLAIITNGGGAGVLAVDDLLDAGGALSELTPATLAALDRLLPPTWSHGNPVDVIGDADAQRYLGAVETVAADPNVDALLVMLCPTGVVDPFGVAAPLADRGSQKPMLTCWLGEASVTAARDRFVARGVPTFTTPGGAIEGFTNLLRFQRRRAALMEAPAVATQVPPAHVAAVGRILSAVPQGWLTPEDARAVIDLYGIPANRIHVAATPELAGAAAEAIGGTVALKVRSPDIVHKTDVGGVILNLNGRAAVTAAAAAMAARIASARPDARLDGFAVEAMVDRAQAQELILGVTLDPTFGLVIAFGRGGTAVAVIGDKALGLPPLNLNLALAMIAETQVGKLLKGYRGQPGADVRAIATALVALSQLVVDHPRITDIDINPLLADARGIIAVDARIKIAATPPETRLVISPYPAALETTLQLRNGARVFVRPLRPEDESAIEALVAALTPEDRRFRFFSPLRGLGHATAARLAQIDYDREIALIAFPVDAPASPWGVARLHGDPDNERAEFALTVASAQQGKGLGYALLQALIRIAQERGTGAIWGQVLRDNTRMLTMCTELGFTSEPAADDPRVVICTRRLRA